MNDCEPVGEAGVACFDDAATQIVRFARSLFYQPEPGAAQSGINTENDVSAGNV